MRNNLALSQTVIIGIREYRKLMYGNAPVQNGYIVSRAYENLLSDLDQIDWVKVNLYEQLFLAKHGPAAGSRVKTSLNVEVNSWKGIEDLRATLVGRNLFGTSRLYLPFVIKLLILGAIMQKEGTLPFIKE